MNLKQKDASFAEKIAKNEKITKDLKMRSGNLHFYLKNLWNKANSLEKDQGVKLPTTKALLKTLLKKVDGAWDESLKYSDFYRH